MKTLTRQQIFNKITKHLLKQNKFSGNPKRPQYHAKNGLKCAIGCLIPDELYHSIIEGVGIDNREMDMSESTSFFNKESALIQILMESGIKIDDFDLISDLQVVHDDEPVDTWIKCLNNVAFEHGLSGIK